MAEDEYDRKFREQREANLASTEKEPVREEPVPKKIEPKKIEKQDEFRMTINVRMTRFLTWLFMITIPGMGLITAYSVVQIIREVVR